MATLEWKQVDRCTWKAPALPIVGGRYVIDQVRADAYFVYHQWGRRHESRGLAPLIGVRSLDEAKALAQADHDQTAAWIAEHA
jgi:hypothetical protein